MTNENMTDHQKLMAKLAALKAQMEDCTEVGSEAEAQAFATMLQNLLAKHKLQMTDIQYQQHLKDEPVEEFHVGGDTIRRDGKRFMSRYPDVEVGKRRIEWCESLMGVIVRAHSCAFLVVPGSASLFIVGRRSDAEIAEYLFVTMMRTADSLAHKDYMKLRRAMVDKAGGDRNSELCKRLLAETHGFKASWLDGFISRLSQRFEEEKRKIEHDTTGTALMRLNKEALAVVDYLKNKFGEDKKGAKGLRGQKGGNELGYQRGRKAADGLNLKANAMEEGEAASPKQLK